MQHEQARGTNWSAIAALAALIASLAALATALLVFREIRQDHRSADLHAGLETLWHMTDEWNSTSMQDTRSRAATALLSGRITDDVDTVLDFFEEAALLINRGALDEEIAWHELYWPMANYWSVTQDHVRQVQRDDPVMWNELQSVLTRLSAIEARHKHRSAPNVGPSPAEVREFLSDEEGQDECADDGEVEKTPL